MEEVLDHTHSRAELAESCKQELEQRLGELEKQLEGVRREKETLERDGGKASADLKAKDTEIRKLKEV